MAKYQSGALVAGIIPAHLELPGGLVGRERIVSLAPERLHHVGARRPEWLLFCLLYAPLVLADPQYLGYRARDDRRRVEFVRQVGNGSRLRLVTVKFLDEHDEAWVGTTHPWK